MKLNELTNAKSHNNDKTHAYFDGSVIGTLMLDIDSIKSKQWLVYNIKDDLIELLELNNPSLNKAYQLSIETLSRWERAQRGNTLPGANIYTFINNLLNSNRLDIKSHTDNTVLLKELSK